MSAKRLIFIAALALGALFALPAVASATVYCVAGNAIDSSCETPEPSLTQALADAAGHAGPDTVLVGPGEYTLPAKPGGGAEAVYNNPSQVLYLRGIGNPHLTMGGTTGSQIGIEVNAAPGSIVEGLHLTIPANVDTSVDIGMVIGGGAAAEVTASHLTIDGPQASEARGIQLNARLHLVDSRIEFPIPASVEDMGILGIVGDVSLSGDTIQSGFGVIGTGNQTITIERSQLLTWHGATSSQGKIVARDSLIRLIATKSGGIGIDIANENPSDATLEAELDGVTIVGGGVQSAGMRVQADENEETATATVTNTVISGPNYALQIWSDDGREAKAIVSYSDLDPASVNLLTGNGLFPHGFSTYLPGAGNINESPGFVNPAAGEYGLAPSSPLIDRGSPTAPPAGELDLAGQSRAIAGTCGGAALRDIGAYEYAPACGAAGGGGTTPGGGGGGAGGGGRTTPARVPQTTIKLKGKPVVHTAAKTAKVTVTLGSSVPGSHFECRVDHKPDKPCGAIFTTRLKPGKHTISAVAVGAAGPDPTPAVVGVRVVRRAT